MKKKKWLETMDLVDEEYIVEADPTKKNSAKKKLWIRWGAIAACLVLIVTAGGLWLLPALRQDINQDINNLQDPTNETDPLLQYQGSEYFEIIQKIEAYRIERNKINANAVDGENIEDMVATGTGGRYVSITDYQVDGVLEADLIKRSDEYAYHVNKNVFEIYSIDGEDSVLVGSYRYEPRWDDEYTTRFYLSQDCKTATLIYSLYHGGTMVLSLDLSNPTHINEIAMFEMSGRYQTSRMVEGSILVFTDTSIADHKIDYSKPYTFLPRIKPHGEWQNVSAEDIVCPQNIVSTHYTTVVRLKEESLELQNIKSFLSYDEMYVSKDMIFMEIFYRKNKPQTTEIVGLNYRDGLEVCGRVSVEGFIKDQYSMDVYNGFLRTVTTTAESASLYCIDLSDWSVAAAVENFAPPGESVRSVRFDGDYAYVCTSLQLIDPVFFFDLSDLSHITYKDTGTISGFSNSLVNFENGNLLGIGLNDRWAMKIEIYKEGEHDVESVCSYVRESVEYSPSYKSYYIDRKNQLLGIGFYDNSKENKEDQSRYLLLHFDGEKLNVLLDVPLKGSPQIKRGFYADGYFYMFGTSDFSVHKISV